MLPPKVELKSDGVDLNSGPCTVTFDDKKVSGTRQHQLLLALWTPTRNGLGDRVASVQQLHRKLSSVVLTDSGAVET